MADGILDVRVNETLLARSVDRGFSASRRLQKPIDLKLNSRGFSQPLGRIKADLNEFDKSLDAASARVLAFGASVGIINGVRRSFSALVKETIAVEESLTKINVVLGANSADIERFGQRLFDVAKNTQQSFSAAAEAATEFSRQGLGLEQTLKRTNDALILTRLSGLETTKAVDALTASVNGFANSALTTTEAVNRLAAVDQAFAVSSKDLAEAISRAGSSAQDANVQFNELIALTASVQQQTARGGAVIGNAFKTIFARVSRGTSIDQLRELGVAIDETQGGVEKLRAIGQAIESADEITAQKIKEISGGVRQINIISAAFRDLNRDISLYDGALNTANSTTDEAILKNDQLNKTLAALSNQAGTNLQEFASTLGSIGLGNNLQSLLEGFNQIIGGLTESLQGDSIGAEIGKSILSGIGNFLTGPGLAVAAGLFLKLFRQIAKDSINAFKSIAGLNTELDKQKNIQKAVLTVLTSQNSQYQNLLAKATTQAEKEGIILSILNRQVIAKKQLERSVGIIAQNPAIRKFSVGKSGDIVKNAAEGIVPTGNGLLGALERERTAISKGAGGASSAATPIVIPNFKFGKNKTGPLVANSDEYILENANGEGASAILTRKMIKELGGAKAVEKLGGKKVPFAADGIAFDRSQIRGPKGQFISEERISQLNRAIKTLDNAFRSGNKDLIASSIKVKDELTSGLSIKSTKIIEGVLRKSRSESISGRVIKGADRPVSSIATPSIESRRVVTQNEDLKKIARTLEGGRRRSIVRASIERFDLDKTLSIPDELNVSEELRTRALKERGLDDAQIKRITKGGAKLSKGLKETLAEVDKGISQAIRDQAKRSSARIKEIRQSTEQQRLEAFNLSKRGPRGILKGGSVSSPEFKALTETQQRGIVQQRSIRGRFGRAVGTARSALRNPLGLSFGASIIGGAFRTGAERANREGPTRAGAALNVGSGIAQGAAFGAILGPQGAAFGALIGGLKSLAEVSDDAANNVSVLTKSLEDQRSSATELSNSVQQVLSSQQGLQDLIAGGGRPSDIQAAQRRLTGAVTSVGDESIRSSIRDILGDSTLTFKEGLDEIARVLANQQTINLRETKITQAILKTNLAETEGRGFFNFGGAFGETDISTENIQDIAREFTAAITSLDPAQVSEIRKSFEDLSGSLGESEIQKAFELIGVEADETKRLLDILGKDFDLSELINAIRKFLDIAKEDSEFVEANTRYQTSLIDSNRALNTVIDNINRISGVRGLSEQREFARSQGGFDVTLATAQFASPIARQIVELEKTNQKILFQQKQNSENLASEFREGIGKLNKTGGLVTEDLKNILKPLSVDPNLGVDAELLFELIGKVNDQTNSESAQFDGVKILLNSLLDSSIKSNDEILTLVDLSSQNLEVAKARTAEQRRQENVGFLGGIESLLSSTPGQFRTFQNRGTLAQSASEAGIFGGGALKEAARGIIEFQKAFKDVGSDIRTFAPESQRIIEESVRSTVADFAVRFPGANIDVAQITRDIADSFFEDDQKEVNEAIKNTEENTKSTVDILGILGRELLKNQQLNDVRSRALVNRAEIRETAGSINQIVSANRALEEQAAEKISSATVTGQFTPADIVNLAGGKLEDFAKRIETTAGGTGKVGFPFGGLIGGGVTQKFGLSERDAAEKISKEANRAASGGSATLGKIFNQEGILKDFASFTGILSESNIPQTTRTLSETGVLDFLNIQELHGIEVRKQSTEALNTELESRKKLAESLSKEVEDIKKGGFSGQSFSAAISQATARSEGGGIGAETPEKGPLSKLELFLARRDKGIARVRQETRVDIAGTVGGRDAEGELTAKSIKILEVLENFEATFTGVNNLTRDQLLSTLNDLDGNLEQFGTDLDSPVMKEFFDELLKSTELLSERNRTIETIARELGRGAAKDADDPFLTPPERRRGVGEAIEKVRRLERGEKPGEVKEFRETFEEESEVKIPGARAKGLFKGVKRGTGRFLEGFKTSTEQLNESLGKLEETGGRVAQTLSVGFGDAFVGAIRDTEKFEDAMKKVIENILVEIAKAQAQKAFTSFLSKVFAPQGANSGGTIQKRNFESPIGLASGGRVPTLLTGGEFSAGPSLVNAFPGIFEGMNDGRIDAGRGIGGDSTGFVQGGSGVKDDVFQMLAPGSVVVNKRATERNRGLLQTFEEGGTVKNSAGNVEIGSSSFSSRDEGAASVSFDINFNMRSGGGRQETQAQEAQEFSKLAVRLQPVIKQAISNELRSGGIIFNEIGDNS